MDLILEARAPHLKPSSVKAYVCSLVFLFNQLQYQGGIHGFNPEDHLLNIIGIANTCNPKRAKQFLSALLVFHPDNESIRTLLKDVGAKDIENDEKQQLTTNQKAAWMDWADIVKVREEYANKCAPLWTKLNLSSKEYSVLQDYILTSVYTHIAPRRLLDFCCMRNGEPENSKENGIARTDDGKAHFVFNVYKTAKHYGQQVVSIPDSLWSILREWMKLARTEWLFDDGEKMFTTSRLNKRLGRIFKRRGFGVNILRHAFVSDEVLKDTPFIKELNEIAHDLGHSKAQTLLYKKHK